MPSTGSRWRPQRSKVDVNSKLMIRWSGVWTLSGPSDLSPPAKIIYQPSQASGRPDQILRSAVEIQANDEHAGCVQFLGLNNVATSKNKPSCHIERMRHSELVVVYRGAQAGNLSPFHAAGGHSNVWP